MAAATKLTLSYGADLHTTDVIISIGSYKFPAHRNKLAENSDYFKAMFSSDMQESKKGDVELKDLSADSFEVIISYIYGSEFQATADNAWDVLKAASMLQFPEIREECVIFLSNNLNPLNCLETIILADRFSLPLLVQSASEMSCWDFPAVRLGDYINKLPFEFFVKYLVEDVIRADTETDVLATVIDWIAQDEPPRSAHLEALLLAVRFGDVEVEEMTAMADMASTNLFRKLRNWRTIAEVVNGLLKVKFGVCRPYLRVSTPETEMESDSAFLVGDSIAVGEITDADSLSENVSESSSQTKSELPAEEKCEDAPEVTEGGSSSSQNLAESKKCDSKMADKTKVETKNKIEFLENRGAESDRCKLEPDMRKLEIKETESDECKLEGQLAEPDKCKPEFGEKNVHQLPVPKDSQKADAESVSEPASSSEPGSSGYKIGEPDSEAGPGSWPTSSLWLLPSYTVADDSFLQRLLSAIPTRIKFIPAIAANFQRPESEGGGVQAMLVSYEVETGKIIKETLLRTISEASSVGTGFRACVIGRHVYTTGSEFKYFEGTSCFSMWRYNAFTKLWNLVCQLRSQRGEHFMCALDKCIYLIGGIGRRRVPLDTVEMFDTVSGIWYDMASLPAPSHLGTCTTYKGNIYVFHNCVFCYTPYTNSWTRVENICSMRDDYFHSAFTSSTSIYLLSSDKNRLIRIWNVETEDGEFEYDHAILASLERTHNCGCCIDGVVYAFDSIGGTATTYNETTEVFKSLNSDPWASENRPTRTINACFPLPILI